MPSEQEPRRVLIVDDELHVRHVLAYRLEAEGLDVHTADDGDEALELARRVRPDLIITDLHMPNLDGLELCVQLKAAPATAHTPVIVLTARGHNLTDEDLARTNVRAIVTKPFSLREVLSKTTALLDGAPVRR